MSYWIQTYTGRAFDLDNPKRDQIDIRDIAHGLAMQSRFCGQCRYHYSIAQHSIYVAEIVERQSSELALSALLHDASEAYHADWSSPLKACIRDRGLVTVLDIEAGIQQSINRKFRTFKHPLIKNADLMMLATEKRDLFGSPPRNNWFAAVGCVPVPRPEPIERWGIYYAECRFLEFFERLSQ